MTKRIIRYCEDCRTLGLLDRTQHVRVAATCELCGQSPISVYVNAYTTAKINRIIATLKKELVADLKKQQAEAEARNEE